MNVHNLDNNLSTCTFFCLNSLEFHRVQSKLDCIRNIIFAQVLNIHGRIDWILLIYLPLCQLTTQIRLLLLLNTSLALIQEHNLLYENLPPHVQNEKIYLIIEPPLLLFLSDCIFRIDKIRKDLLFCIEYNPCVRARKLAYFGYLEVYSLRWKLPNIYLLLLHE